MKFEVWSQCKNAHKSTVLPSFTLFIYMLLRPFQRRHMVLELLWISGDPQYSWHGLTFIRSADHYKKIQVFLLELPHLYSAEGPLRNIVAFYLCFDVRLSVLHSTYLHFYVHLSVLPTLYLGVFVTSSMLLALYLRFYMRLAVLPSFICPFLCAHQSSLLIFPHTCKLNHHQFG